MGLLQLPLTAAPADLDRARVAATFVRCDARDPKEQLARTSVKQDVLAGLERGVDLLPGSHPLRRRYRILQLRLQFRERSPSPGSILRDPTIEFLRIVDDVLRPGNHAVGNLTQAVLCSGESPPEVVVINAIRTYAVFVMQLARSLVGRETLRNQVAEVLSNIAEDKTRAAAAGMAVAVLGATPYQSRALSTPS